MIAAIFAQSAIPGMAEAVAFLDINTSAFHYARLVGQGVMQTDANRYDEPGMGGTLSHFKMNSGKLDFVGQRGIQPVDHFPTLGDFVQYCQSRYEMSACLFFFCRFT
jgi:hypothetical protein